MFDAMSLFLVFVMGASLGFLLTSPSARVIIGGSKGRPSLVRSERRGDSDYILTFSNATQYRGECTVWRHYPSGKRCNLATEMWLSDVVAELEWREEDLREGGK